MHLIIKKNNTTLTAPEDEKVLALPDLKDILLYGLYSFSHLGRLACD
jgi:hypothetical protein